MSITRCGYTGLALDDSQPTWTIDSLGYDPQPEVMTWGGTPIPPVDRPLALTPERAAICERVWWWGGAEIALRNARRYIYHVIDYGSIPQWQFTLDDVERDIWHYALNTAREGIVSRGGHRLSCILVGADISRSDSWSLQGHKNDAVRLIYEKKWIRAKGRIVA